MLWNTLWISKEDSSWCQGWLNTIFLLCFRQIQSRRKISVCSSCLFSSIWNQPCFPNSPFLLSAYGEDSGKEHSLGFLRAWAAEAARALSFRSLSRNFSRKRPRLWIKMMMMMMMWGRRVSPITGCIILQINCDYFACITSVTASDYEDEHLQIRKCWNWDCKIAVVTWFIRDCQNTLLVVLVSASVSPLGFVPLSENAISQYFSSLCQSVLDPT